MSERVPRTIDDYRSAYRRGSSPRRVLRDALALARAGHTPNIWIRLLSEDELDLSIARLEQMDPRRHPLWGVPFAIKDNIDLANIATTAACPDFSYVPTQSAHVVQRLIDAGAVALGKCNMDQFATGLTGMRTPYGVPRNVLAPHCVPGGSSSGSAVAVAAGLVPFALGTDTAGSGRVPAAFNEIIGLKPTPGAWSTRGVVPACRSLDCVTVFTHTLDDAAMVWNCVAGFDAQDPFSRRIGQQVPCIHSPRLGIPPDSQREFYGDGDYAEAYAAAIETWQRSGAQIKAVDCRALWETAALLYEGPWLAERYAALENLMIANPQAVLPVLHTVLAPAKSLTAAQAFRAQHRLATLRREVDALFTTVDALLLPTAPTLPTLATVAAEPIGATRRLGMYTNFANLLDLAALALPARRCRDGRPFGTTLFAPAGHDLRLMDWARGVLSSRALASRCG